MIIETIIKSFLINKRQNKLDKLIMSRLNLIIKVKSNFNATHTPYWESESKSQ